MNTPQKIDELISYSSDRMRERRQSVMRTVRRYIAEDGLQGLTMRKVAAESGISTATLFNIYGNRENLIHLAVLDAFHASLGGAVTDKPDCFDSLILYVKWTSEEIIKLDNYVKFIVSSYFSINEFNGIREILQRETKKPYNHFLNHILSRSDINPKIEISCISEMIADHIFSCMRKWSLGLIPNDRLTQQLWQGIEIIINGYFSACGISNARPQNGGVAPL